MTQTQFNYAANFVFVSILAAALLASLHLVGTNPWVGGFIAGAWWMHTFRYMNNE